MTWLFDFSFDFSSGTHPSILRVRLLTWVLIFPTNYKTVIPTEVSQFFLFHLTSCGMVGLRSGGAASLRFRFSFHNGFARVIGAEKDEPLEEEPQKRDASQNYPWVNEYLVFRTQTPLLRQLNLIAAFTRPMSALYVQVDYFRVAHDPEAIRQLRIQHDPQADISLLIRLSMERSRDYHCPGPPPIEPRSAIISEGSCRVAALRFSRRCSTEDVPGISMMLGER